MTDETFAVKVYVYDISHGMAKMYSQMMLGINLDAIYHTSVVIYDKEYYIDGGIQVGTPGKTRFGIPIEVLDIGETYVTEDIFQEFIDEFRSQPKYSPLGYDLFDNNCNHFTDNVLEFLVGKNLENRILELPQKVLATPNGKLLKSMIGTGQLM